MFILLVPTVDCYKLASPASLSPLTDESLAGSCRTDQHAGIGGLDHQGQEVVDAGGGGRVDQTGPQGNVGVEFKACDL